MQHHMLGISLGFAGGFVALYPVFAQYKPPVRCKTVFDNGNYSFLTFSEIKLLSTGNDSKLKNIRTFFIFSKRSKSFLSKPF